MNVNLSKTDLEILEIYLNTNPCSNGCVYEKMQNSKKDCEDCKLTKNKYALLQKLKLT